MRTEQKVLEVGAVDTAASHGEFSAGLYEHHPGALCLSGISKNSLPEYVECLSFCRAACVDVEHLCMNEGEYLSYLLFRGSNMHRCLPGTFNAGLQNAQHPVLLFVSSSSGICLLR